MLNKELIETSNLNQRRKRSGGLEKLTLAQEEEILEIVKAGFCRGTNTFTMRIFIQIVWIGRWITEQQCSSSTYFAKLS